MLVNAKLYLFESFEFAFALLAFPKTASVVLRDMERRNVYATFWAALSSASLATGLFYLRDAYTYSFFVFIPVLALVVYVYSRAYSRLLAARIMVGPLPRGAGESMILPALVEGSCLPGLFFLPLSITAREFSHPFLLLLPGLIGILAWMLYIQYTGLTYSLEIDRRRAIGLLVRNHFVLLLFPFVAVYFFAAVFISLLGSHFLF